MQMVHRLPGAASVVDDEPKSRLQPAPLGQVPRGRLQAAKQRSPRTEVIMITAHGSVETAVGAMKAGAYDYVEKPFQSDRLLTMVRRGIEAARLRRENRELRLRGGPETELIGNSPAVTTLRNAVDKVAPTGPVQDAQTKARKTPAKGASVAQKPAQAVKPAAKKAGGKTEVEQKPKPEAPKKAKPKAAGKAVEQTPATEPPKAAAKSDGKAGKKGNPKSKAAAAAKPKAAAKPGKPAKGKAPAKAAGKAKSEGGKALARKPKGAGEGKAGKGRGQAAGQAGVQLSAAAGAQIQAGSISGAVKDEQGGVLPGVLITAQGLDATLTFTTEGNGEYRFLNLAPGPYKVTAALTGFTNANLS